MLLNKVLCYVAIVLCVMAVLLDSASKLNSMLIDGALMAVVIGVLIRLVKGIGVDE